VTALSMSQQWDHQLATRKDACHLSDRVTLAPISGTTAVSNNSYPLGIYVSNGSSVTSGNLGIRVSDIGGCYLRYRINRLLACWRPIVGTNTAGRISMGFLDDAFPFAASDPTVGITVTDLRCSHSDSVYRDIEVEWKPVDKKKWYYVDLAAAAASADQRFSVPCILVVLGEGLPTTTTLYGGVTVYYDITFEGATTASPTAP